MAHRRRGQYPEQIRRTNESASPVPQDLTEENAQLVLGEKASHLASAGPKTLPFVPYHPEELRQRGHRQRPGTQRRRALQKTRLAGHAPDVSAVWTEGVQSTMPT